MRTVLAHCMILTAGVANAQSLGADTLGDGPCAQFAQQFKQNPSSEHIWYIWAKGFMSGVNSATSKTYRDLAAMSEDNQLAYLRSYCDQHPLGDYRDAVASLFTRLPERARPKE